MSQGSLCGNSRTSDFHAHHRFSCFRASPQGVGEGFWPPDRFNDLARPFARGDSGASGTGLGLAIVRALVDRSALRLAFFSPAGGQKSGVEAVLTLDPLKSKEAAPLLGGPPLKS